MNKQLKKSDWRYNLHGGDEITWNDPDAGLCNKGGVLSSIEYLGDDSARITMRDGWSAEVFLQELS